MEEEKIVAKKAEAPKPKTNYLIISMSVALVILAVLAAFFGWQYFKVKQDNDLMQNQINALNEDLNNAKKDVSELNNQSTSAPTPTPIISTTLKQNVADAINTMNTAALEGYMADSVTVVLAASEFGDPRTPAEAVSDLNYLSSATTPWDFNLPSAVMNGYQAGWYAVYFGNNTIVGKSANDYVVSFGINSAGKIDTIFMAVNADLLL